MSYLKNIRWGELIGFQGRCSDLPALMEQVQGEDRLACAQALINLEQQLLNDNKMVIATPFVVHFLLEALVTASPHQALLLRSLYNYVRAIGFEWNVYHDDVKQFEYMQIATLADRLEVDYPFEEVLGADPLQWLLQDNTKMFADAWYYTRAVVLKYKGLLDGLEVKDLIEQGILYEMMNIVRMVKDQERKVFDLTIKCESPRLAFETIDQQHWKFMVEAMTPNVTQYLSFDVDSKGILLREYIRQSILEQGRGVNVVFAILEKGTGEFLGSCGIYDINDETVELGLWLKEGVYGKGYGGEVVERLIKFVEDNIKTQCILYSVELANTASLRIAHRMGFIATKDYVLEPTVLKNNVRSMRQFVKYINGCNKKEG